MNSRIPFTFRQLEAFVAAAQDCNFRRASDRLHVSQPSISSHIRSLETRLGYSLFERRRGAAPKLTYEGHQFLSQAQEILRGKTQIGSDDTESFGARKIQLTVMAGPILLDTCIRPQLPSFCREHPDINLEFVPLHPSKDPIQLLNSGDIDLAVYTGDRAQDLRVESEEVTTVGCSIYASSDLARQAREEGSQLDDLPWVMPPKNFSPTQFMWRFLREAGVHPRNIIARTQFPDVATRMVLCGYAVAVLFDDLAATGLAAGRIARIGPALPEIPRMLVIGARARQSACQPVVDLLRQAIKTPLPGVSL